MQLDGLSHSANLPFLSLNLFLAVAATSPIYSQISRLEQPIVLKIT